MASTSHLRGYVDIIGYMVVFIMATNASTVRANATCGRELGMKNGAIKDVQISASTTFTSALGPWKPSYARIGNQYAWYPSSYNTNQWLQVDLRRQMAISGVQTQGHHSDDSYYVKSFKLNYTADTGLRWQEAFQGKIFGGNRAANQIKVNNFTVPIVASAIRFLPQTWNNGIALRVELLGCDLSEIPTTRSPTILPVTAVPTVTSTAESTGNSSAVSSSTIPIAAGAAGGLVLLVVIIVIAIVCRRKSRGRSDTVKLEDIQDPPVRTEERPEEVDFVRNDLYESADNIRATEPRMGEHTEQDSFVRNDLYESVDRTSEDSINVTLLPTNEGAAALYTAVNKTPRGADDSGMVENIIYE